MIGSIKLRQFAPEDIVQVVDLLQSVSVYRPDSVQILELARLFVGHEDSYACVVVQGDRVLGFGSLFILRRIRGGRSAIIEDVVVDAELRGRGIGRLVVTDLVAQARTRGCFKVSLEASDTALAFYEACGFSFGGQAMCTLL